MAAGQTRRRPPLTRRGVVVPAVLLMAILPACRAAATPSSASPFATDPLWDDGRAEVNAYEATESRYGIDRPFTAYHIVVKEDFARQQLVKADPGHDPEDLVTVLKLNQVVHLQTGIYDYHQMASTFHERASMGLLKFSLASFEWCGNTYKEFTRREGRAALHVRTYWDGQAEATYDLPAGPEVILYDELPLWIRSLPQRTGTRRTMKLVPGQIHSKGPRPVLRDATLSAGGEETLETPAGRFDVVRWELADEGGTTDTYWIAAAFPHLLVAWDRSDGGRYRLKSSQRLAYWELSRPGDERFLQDAPPVAD